MILFTAGRVRRKCPHGRHDREVGQRAWIEEAGVALPLEDEARPLHDLEQQRPRGLELFPDQRSEFVRRIGGRIARRLRHTKSASLETRRWDCWASQKNGIVAELKFMALSFFLSLSLLHNGREFLRVPMAISKIVCVGFFVYWIFWMCAREC